MMHIASIATHPHLLPALQAAHRVQVDRAWVQRVPDPGPAVPPVGRGAGMGVGGGAASPRPRHRQLPSGKPHGRHLPAGS